MPSTIFTQTLWRPGEPLEPNAEILPPLEVTQRLMHIEKSLDDLSVGDLPVSDLEKTLEQTWLPDPNTLFAAGGIGNEVTEFATYHGQVGSAGTIVLAGSGDWTVSRVSQGIYDVTFPALKNVPVVLTTNAGPSLRLVRTIVSTLVKFTVTWVDTSNAVQDTDFMFEVKGR
jgi:hypothetical protein